MRVIHGRDYETGMFEFARQSKLTETEQQQWERYKREQQHACRTPVDWADLFATINHLKRRLMSRNGTPPRTARDRRQHIMAHL